MNHLIEMGQKAVIAKYALQKMSTDSKNKALEKIAEDLIKNQLHIISENAKDIQNGIEHGMHQGLLDRLNLDETRIKDMSEGISQIVTLEDPIGEILEQKTRPNGLEISKKRVPIGVIGIIYESRPNVTVDAFGLCFKTGNAVILKGGKDAIHSNKAIYQSIRESLSSCHMNPDAIQLITDTDRAVTEAFMKLNEYVDVLIPRGGAGLIQSVVMNSTIPVIETGSGNCHIYVDEFANIEQAVSIIMNAKTQRIGVCNACESLVIHKNIAKKAIPIIEKALSSKQVLIYGDDTSMKLLQSGIPATEEDYGKEYLDYAISIKTVDSIEEAISHINQYNTKHSEVIITENKENANQFLNEIDSACVYVNASSRFSDGFEFGFGAEIGISTQKLHARGPMGLKELTSYKYIILGNGQIRG